MLNSEIGHADALGQALLVYFLACLPDFFNLALMLLGGVDEPKIDILNTQPLE